MKYQDKIQKFGYRKSKAIKGLGVALLGTCLLATASVNADEIIETSDDVELSEPLPQPTSDFGSISSEELSSTSSDVSTSQPVEQPKDPILEAHPTWQKWSDNHYTDYSTASEVLEESGLKEEWPELQPQADSMVTTTITRFDENAKSELDFNPYIGENVKLYANVEVTGTDKAYSDLKLVVEFRSSAIGKGRMFSGASDVRSLRVSGLNNEKTLRVNDTFTVNLGNVVSGNRLSLPILIDYEKYRNPSDLVVDLKVYDSENLVSTTRQKLQTQVIEKPEFEIELITKPQDRHENDPLKPYAGVWSTTSEKAKDVYHNKYYDLLMTNPWGEDRLDEIKKLISSEKGMSPDWRHIKRIRETVVSETGEFDKFRNEFKFNNSGFGDLKGYVENALRQNVREGDKFRLSETQKQYVKFSTRSDDNRIKVEFGGYEGETHGSHGYDAEWRAYTSLVYDNIWKLTEEKVLIPIGRVPLTYARIQLNSVIEDSDNLTNLNVLDKNGLLFKYFNNNDSTSVRENIAVATNVDIDSLSDDDSSYKLFNPNKKPLMSFNARTHQFSTDDRITGNDLDAIRELVKLDQTRFNKLVINQPFAINLGTDYRENDKPINRSNQVYLFQI